MTPLNSCQSSVHGGYRISRYTIEPINQRISVLDTERTTEEEIFFVRHGHAVLAELVRDSVMGNGLVDHDLNAS
jgi:hypothetical protein